MLELHVVTLPQYNILQLIPYIL